jgi:hypothetical protein
MKTSRSKTSTVIALFLMFAMIISLVALLPVSAQAPTLKTYPFVDAVPNPVGVGEDVLIRFGILQQSGDVTYGWQDLTVTITGPDGKKETIERDTDSTGSTFYVTSFDVAGTYKLQTHFPEQENPVTFFNMEGGNMIFAGTILLESDSDVLELVVTEEPSKFYPGHPLPTEYWTRPIDPQLREWFLIAGNWVVRPDNSLALYNDDAPETAHVLWAKPLTTGGLVGGLWGPGQVPSSAETGDAYAGKFIDSVVMNGILYYNRDDAKVGSNGIVAVDLRTGEELWFRNNTVLSFGQIFYFNSFNYDGVFDYLWETQVIPDPLPDNPTHTYAKWNAYDPFTGEWIYTMTNVPQTEGTMSTTRVFGSSGEIFIYVIDYTNDWLALWNSTAAGQTAPGFAIEPAAYGSWGAYYAATLVHGSTLNASDPRAYSWNVSIPAGLTAGQSFFVPILKVYPDRVMSIDFNQTRVRVWALDTEDLTATSTSASTIFDKSWNAPAEWLDGSNTLHYVGATNEVENGVIAVWSKELRKHYGFSTVNGSFLWETDSEHFLDAYGWGNVEHTWYFAYGKLYSVGVAGIVYAYDLTTGDTAWTYNMTDPYREPVTGNNWWGWISVIADEKVYVGTLEHSAEMPLPRGGPFICLNATNGDEIWRVNGMFRQTRWGGCAVMGDSIIATMDTYDQRIYAIGKGPSATTVAASPKSSVHGNSVVVEGMVTDISAGTKDDALTARFPNGVPAVSDANMSDWMLHVYKQFEKPADVVGVEVIVSVLDPNNNCYEVARATSDASGYFGCTFEPLVPGFYKVIATFEGSGAYYGSYAETFINVEEAPAATPVPTPVPQEPVGTYFAISTIVLLVAIAVAVILLLRKR